MLMMIVVYVIGQSLSPHVIGHSFILLCVHVVIVVTAEAVAILVTHSSNWVHTCILMKDIHISMPMMDVRRSNSNVVMWWRWWRCMLLVTHSSNCVHTSMPMMDVRRSNSN